MFTGIVEEIGSVVEFSKFSNGAKIRISCKNILENMQIGDSIAINGCCQTVTDFGSDFFTADVSDETLKITNFSNVIVGDKVNLERALTPTSRIGGHIVQGHIDCCAKLIKIEKLSAFYNLCFEIPSELAKYVVQKGSIAINGVSLTVAEINQNIFKVAVIPHTYNNTTLSELRSQDIVNIETDVLGRYIEKLLSTDNNSNSISEKFLIENGFM